MNHVQAGVELPFTVLPESSALFQPRKGSLDHPSLLHHGEVSNSLLFAIWTLAPSISFTASANGLPE